MIEMHAFTMNEHGLFYRLPSGADVRLSGPFKVVATAQNADGTIAAVLLQWKDPDGQDHQWVMSRALLARNAVAVRRVLLDGGLFVASNRGARKKLAFYLANARPSPVKEQPLQNGTTYLLPAEPPADLIVAMAEAHEGSHYHDLIGPMEDAYRALTDWCATQKEGPARG